MYKNNGKYRDGISLFNSIGDGLKNGDTYAIGIELYSKLNDVCNCEGILDSTDVKDVRIYNAMLNSYNDHGMYGDTVKLFESEKMKILRDNASCTMAIKAYLKMNDVGNAEKIFESIQKKDKFVYIFMMQGYNQSKMYHKAIELFESNPMKKYHNNVSYNIAIQAYSKLNKITECEGIFNNIEYKNKAIFGSMMKAYNDNCMYANAVELFMSKEMEPYKDDVNCNIAIGSYSGMKNIDGCEKIFDSISRKNHVSLNIMMQAYNDNKLYHQAIELYFRNDMVSNRNNSSSNIVIQSYSSLKEIDQCEGIFSSIARKNETNYGCIMQAYNDNEMYHKTIELFCSNEMNDMKDNINCNIAMQAYSRLNKIEKCEEIFDSILDKSDILYNCLMQVYNDSKMYSKTIDLFVNCGNQYKDNIGCNIAMQAYSKLNKIDQCEHIFNNIIHKNSIIYNCMMQVYFGNKMYSKVIELYLSDKMVPFKDHISDSVAIQSYSKLNNMDECVSLFNNIRIKNESIYSSMMQAYNDHNMYEKTIELFETNQLKVYQNNIISNIAIIAYSKMNNIEMCQEIFDQIDSKNDIIYNSMMQVYNDNQEYHKTIQLFASHEMKKFKDNISANIAIQAYSKLNDIPNCESVFNSISDKSTIASNGMMQAYNDNNMPLKTIEMFTSKIENKDIVTYNIVLQAYNDAKMYHKTIELYLSDEMENEKDITSSNIVIQAYSKSGDVSNCEAIFNSMTKKDIITYSVMMNAYRSNDKHHDAVKLFDIIWNQKIPLSPQIFCHAIYASIDMASLDKGREILHQLNTKQYRNMLFDGYILAAIISFHGTYLNNIDHTRKLYNTIINSKYIQTNKTSIHKSMMDCYTKHNNIDQVFTIFESLKSTNEPITDEIYSIILNSCSHSNNETKSIQILTEYLHNNNNIISNPYILTPIIDCLSRNNKLDKAEYYYNEYNKHLHYYRDKIIILKCILSGCRTYNDITRSHKIIKIIESLSN